jgi:polysaccharide deacetylase family protein (PEP-CTERM system associated)
LPDAGKRSILLTIDVEDWFQVENFRRHIPFSSWTSHDLRVEKNTYVLLDILDESAVRYPVSGSQICATFFILGWIAERLPHLVREIHNRGHEVASHGYSHKLCNECSPEELKTDLTHSKWLLEDIIGDRVYGYRAPSFSVNNDILKLIRDSDYVYDSSFNSFGLHERYGRVVLTRNGGRGIAFEVDDNFYELPISNIAIGPQVIPWGGGGYFRLIPYPLFRIGIQFLLFKQKAFLFYCHPWELDSEQPKVTDVSFFYRFRHYVNLDKTQFKLKKIIESFKASTFVTCRQYLQNNIFSRR